MARPCVARGHTSSCVALLPFPVTVTALPTATVTTGSVTGLQRLRQTLGQSVF